MPATQDQAKSGSETEDSTLPSAEEVVDKYVHALGGYEILESRNKIRHSYNASFNGSPFHIEAYQCEGKYYSQSTFPDGRVTQRGFLTDWKTDRNGARGGVGWENRDGVVREMTTKELQEYIRRRGYCCPAPMLLRIYENVKCESIEQVNGFDAYQLRFVDHDGTEVRILFDVETGFYVRRIVVEEFDGSTHEVVRDYLDYARMGGCLVPTKLTTKSPNSETIYELESFEADVKIPKKTFDLPPTIAEKTANAADAQTATKK